MEMNLQQTIDQSLKIEYHDICINPQKRDTLSRLTRNSRQYLQGWSSLQSHLPSEGLIDNNVLNYYIQDIYRQYNIQDPINKELKLMKIQDTNDLTTLKTPNKKIQSSFNSQKTTTRKKLQQMQQSYKQDSNEIISSTFHIDIRPKRNSQYSALNYSRVSRQIGYRTRQKIHFKTHTNDDTLYIHRGVSKPQAIARPNSPHIFQFRQSKNMPLTAYGSILKQFSYCLMCEQPIQEQNKKYHQAECSSTQKMHDIPIDELERKVAMKIQKMKAELQQKLMQNSEKQILEQHRCLNRTVTEWLTKQDEGSLQKIQRQYQKIALDQFELITKLNWFKQLHRKILEQRKRQQPVE